MSQAPGWYRDPFFRAQERYWDGRIWTQGTRPMGAEAEAAQGSDALADSAGLQHGGPGAVDPAPGAPSEPFVDPAAVVSTEQPSFPPLGAPVQPVVAAPAGGPATWAPPTFVPAGPAGYGQGVGNRHRRGAILGIGAAALVLVAGGVSAALFVGGSGNASAEEAVSNAAAQTINAHSADMSMSVNVNVPGGSQSVTGSGAFDFAHQVGTMTVTIPVNGKQVSEQEILDGSTVYVNIGGLGAGGLLPTNKPWISENVNQTGASGSNLGTLDPTSMLQNLQSIGGTVTTLGQTNYDGTSVNEYKATLPASALESAIGNLPSSLQQSVAGVHLPDMTMDIYVTQDSLLKAVVLPSYAFSVAGQSVSMSMSVGFSNYGTTVNVTPPPASEVQPLSGLGGGLGNSGTTGDSGSTI